MYRSAITRSWVDGRAISDTTESVMSLIVFGPHDNEYLIEPDESRADWLVTLGYIILNPWEVPAGVKIPAGIGYATSMPDFDFESYSEAGLQFVDNKWKTLDNCAKRGLPAIGAAAYTEHPSTEVLSIGYNLKDGKGKRLWIPGMPPPLDLFAHIQAGGLLEAWNSSFEFHMWTNVCFARMGWPELPLAQYRDAMAKSRAHSLPGGLEKAGEILRVKSPKIEDGKRLLKKFSVPRNPTKNDPRTRIKPEEDLVDADKLYEYNLGDIDAESCVSMALPDMSDDELELWLLDQEINTVGVAIDTEALSNCISIVNQAYDKYLAELKGITGGVVNSAGENAKMIGWLGARGIHLPNLQAETVEKTLGEEWINSDLPAKRVLEIRESLGAASVKKLFSIRARLSKDGRLKDLFAFCGADRTGRFAGRGPQPQNLPNSGPEVARCLGCGRHYILGVVGPSCPWCRVTGAGEIVEWNVEAVEDALEVIALKDLATVEHYMGDAVAAVAGCLRGLFCAAPGHDLICSDYSAIEAVVLAALAGEEWRMEVFRTHGMIYEMSAAKITGIPFEQFQKHKAETGDHHPLRKKIGKVAELASGYQGGLGAWIQFGADKHLSEAEIKESIKSWRIESPRIVKFWYGLEEAAILAIQNPGQCFQYGGISYGVKDNVLYCKLLSGRTLSYHKPVLVPTLTPWGADKLQITYMGREATTNAWVRLDTYGGKLCENVVQATARDILTYAMVNEHKAGYKIVLHIHDEIVSEVPKGFGSVEEFEQIMATLPPWAKDWPIKAAGGWRGKRYRKD